MKNSGILKFIGRLFIVSATLWLFFPTTAARANALSNGEDGAQASLENKTAGFETVPVKIVSTAPAITEILFYIGAGDKLAGVTGLCDYPAEARNLPKIGDLNLNYEKILEIKPDAVFLMKGLRSKEFEVLEAFGSKPVELDLGSIENIFDSIDRAARILRAPRNSSGLRKRLKKLEALIAKKQKNIMRSVYFEIWGEPPMTIGGPSFINGIIERAHGINIFGESSVENLAVSAEKVIENNPQFIVAAYEVKTSEIALRPGFSNIIAVKESNVVTVDYNIYVRPGPRVVDAVLDLYNKLYPDERISAEELDGAETRDRR